MSNLRIQPGEILWLKRLNDETKELVGAGVDEGMLDHPVVILGVGVKGKGIDRSRHIQINIITSFGGQLLEKKFPGKSLDACKKRERYIPLYRQRWEKVLQPDTKRVLQIEYVGEPQVPRKGKTSYVTLGKPIYVGQEHLTALWGGKTNLTFEALQIVVEQVNDKYTPKGITKVRIPKNQPRTPEGALVPQRNPNTTLDSNQPPRTPAVQAPLLAPAPPPVPAASQTDPLDGYYRPSSNYGAINGSVHDADLEAARRSPESSRTWGRIVFWLVLIGAGIGVCVGLGYAGSRLAKWVVLEGKLLIGEGKRVILEAWEFLREFLKNHRPEVLLNLLLQWVARRLESWMTPDELARTCSGASAAAAYCSDVWSPDGGLS